jgi:hypothetical protein
MENRGRRRAVIVAKPLLKIIQLFKESQSQHGKNKYQRFCLHDYT